MTIRHLFYGLVTLGQIEKTEREYKLLCHHLAKWRRAGKVPWEVFADGTRWWHGTHRYDSMEEALRDTAETCRRNSLDAVADLLLDAADP